MSVRILGMVAFILVLSSVCYGQYPGYEEDLHGSITNTELIIADLRPKLFGDLPASESKVYRQIHFEVTPDTQHIQAYAWIDKGGDRRVTVTEAMGRAIKLNVDAFLIEKLTNRKGFLGQYMDYVSSRYVANDQRYARGLASARIESPYEMAHISIEKMFSDEDINNARVQIEGGAFAFLLAHEVAHHALEHTDHPTTSKSIQRQRESAADEWAINLLVRKAVNPVDGIVPLLLDYYSTQHAISTESERDHPADAKRLLAMYEGLKVRLPEFRHYISASGQNYSDVQKQVDLAIQAIHDEIDKDK